MRTVELQWAGTGQQFLARGVQPATPEVRIDGDAETGASPMLHLLMAAAGCSGIDVVVILQKMRIQLTHFAIRASGERRSDDPRRFISIDLRFELAGEGLTEAKACRAVALSVEKYCSVIHSLAPDIVIRTHVAVR